MSIPIITTPENPISREQAITDIIESIALEETALAHIINVEGEKIQAAIKLSKTNEDLLLINSSVKNTLKTIIQKEIILLMKLETAKELV